MNAAVPTLDLLRRLAERHARQELVTHGRLNPCALLFHGTEADVVYPNEDEAWSHFVQHMLGERTTYKAHAVVLYREVMEHRYVEVAIMPTNGVPITLHISTEGACRT